MWVRTVLGDVAAGELGVCGAHEHVIIDDAYVAATMPEFRLDEVDRAVEELAHFKEAGGGAMVDAMPINCGGSPEKLAEVSRRAGVHLIASTGLHLAEYYDKQWIGMDAQDFAEIWSGHVERGRHRAGVVKVAAKGGRMSDVERIAFTAAAMTQRRTGCPILTHTAADEAIDEQIAVLWDAGADLSHVVLSHTDRNPDVAAHRRWLRTGVVLEYDQHFRDGRSGLDNPTVMLIATLAAEHPTQIAVGMDAARRRYWRSYGGSPGLDWLITGLRPMLAAAGVSDELLRRIYIDNPAAAYAFAPVHAQGARA